MKYTLLVTQKCNLDCTYCYIGKTNSTMTPEIAGAAVELIYDRSPRSENIDIGFFGGEPLLEFELLQSITTMIEGHRKYDADRVTLSVVTNGTILDDSIVEFLHDHEIDLCVSCDGPPAVQDSFRRFRSGRGSSATVEATITKALEAFPSMPVNAVHTPSTVMELPETVKYLLSLGVKRVFLNADYSADWTRVDVDSLESVYDRVAEQYIEHYRRDDPRFINLIDNKITVILRGGYQPLERCRMGTGELSFAPSGNIYPCERLVGADDGVTHCIGHVRFGIEPGRMACKSVPGGTVNLECRDCGIRDYCMNWCGCSNYFSSGSYNRVGSFLCASEQTAVRTAFRVFQRLDQELDGAFMEHLSGRPYANAMRGMRRRNEPQARRGDGVLRMRRR